MIRQTLAATQAATFAVNLPEPALQGLPRPVGTGFFVSEDGLFLTARHVLCDSSGTIRTDIADAWLTKELRLGQTGGPVPALCQWPSLVWEDSLTDLALLRVPFSQNADKAWLANRSGFPAIEISDRQLEEGEPVYSFGYPLSFAEVTQSGAGATVGATTLHPRVTSAIVASTLEASGMVQTGGDPQTYVLDKALNYGNSGGPIIAVETGHTHAVCTRFQPVRIPQPHLLDRDGNPTGVNIPSLYGVVVSLTNPPFLNALHAAGGAITHG